MGSFSLATSSVKPAPILRAMLVPETVVKFIPIECFPPISSSLSLMKSPLSVSLRLNASRVTSVPVRRPTMSATRVELTRTSTPPNPRPVLLMTIRLMSLLRYPTISIPPSTGTSSSAASASFSALNALSAFTSSTILSFTIGPLRSARSR